MSLSVLNGICCCAHSGYFVRSEATGKAPLAVAAPIFLRASAMILHLSTVRTIALTSFSRVRTLLLRSGFAVLPRNPFSLETILFFRLASAARRATPTTSTLTLCCATLPPRLCTAVPAATARHVDVCDGGCIGGFLARRDTRAAFLKVTHDNAPIPPMDNGNDGNDGRIMDVLDMLFWVLFWVLLLRLFAVCGLQFMGSEKIEKRRQLSRSEMHA